MGKTLDYRSQKIGCFFIINQILQLSFRSRQLGYCNSSIRTMNNFIHNLERFPINHIVQFKYYSGKYLLFQERYKNAKEQLDYAFKQLYKDSTNKKPTRKILELLIPINLLFGIFPSVILNQKCPISYLQKLTRGVKLGYLKSFRKQIDVKQQLYIDKGILLSLLHIEPLLFRKIIARSMIFRINLFRLKQIRKPNIIPINFLKQILRISGYSILNDELECIIANLIWKGTIKGYIAHEKALVLSKDNPFPILIDSYK